MRVKTLKPEKFNNRLNRNYLIDKTVYLHATVGKQSKVYPGIDYYLAYIEVPKDDLLGTVELYGHLLISKLRVFDGYEPPLPMRIILTRWWNDNMKLINDIEFLDPETIDDHFLHKIPDGWDKDIRKALPKMNEYQQARFDFSMKLYGKDKDDDNK